MSGNLIIVSGPSGSGKSTVVRKLLATCELPLQLSISVTTRQPRSGEIDGRDYYFVTHAEFAQRKSRGEFLECKEVFGQGEWYGTLAVQVYEGLDADKWMILEIDVQGALSVMQKHPEAISFFIHPGSLPELEARLRRRGTESEASIRRRLEVAEEELTALSHYKYEIINREIEHSVREMCQILEPYSHGATKHA
ncbi:MAG: guanylate kinase [Planctomycetales bacterium]|nr:guanylate kinase [Planctomycetales bacterium]